MADDLSRDNMLLFLSLVPQGCQSQIPWELVELLITLPTGLGFRQLDIAVQGYLDNALTHSSRQCYQSVINSYHRFCEQFSVSTPFPLSHLCLCRFISFLASGGVSHATIKVYLSGLRYAQIVLSFDPGFSNFPQLELVLRGIRRVSSNRRRVRLPITPRILVLLFQSWSIPPVSYDTVMLWAACCTGFIGFLRSAEFTSPNVRGDVEPGLSVADVSVDSLSQPSYVALLLRRSKTDTFGMGATVYLGLVDGVICPVKALLAYVAVRGNGPGPLFVFQDGSPLTWPALVRAVWSALRSHNIDVSSFNGHSFRIGAATTAAACGIPDSLIQVLGRWKSSAFTEYIRTPRETLASVLARLIPS